ncbi:MAG: hypothetical protein QOK03_1737 [Candidatus Binataceae bacterium]|jgi:hypothetical protein|nr:hypothetical protein [Candidatus Binataceae bacterium]
MSVQFERDSEPGKSFPSDLISANRLTWTEVKQLLLPFDWRNDQTEVSRDQRETLARWFSIDRHANAMQAEVFRNMNHARLTGGATRCS